MKVGLYSVTYLGIWYEGGALSLSEVFARARGLGFAGVEIDGKRPHGNPMDLDARARRELKAIAEHEGIEVCAVSANNDFSSPVPEQWECQVLMARELIRLAADLGAPVVRLFLAWPGVTYRADGLADYDIARRRWEEIWRDTTRREVWSNARRAFRELAAIGSAEGVTLALQNHRPVIEHYRDVLDMIEEVDSPAFQACIDASLLGRQDDEFVRGAVQAVAGHQAHSHLWGEFQRNGDGRVVQRPLRPDAPVINYPAFVRALDEIGYDRYLCYEFCHRTPDAPHRRGRAYVDEQVALAAEYMHDVLLVGRAEAVGRGPS
jgi:sugar phosphate isomerase/epimerase